MGTIADIRAKFPDDYKDMSDQQIADGLYTKYYSDMPRSEFNKKIGYTPNVGAGEMREYRPLMRDYVVRGLGADPFTQNPFLKAWTKTLQGLFGSEGLGRTNPSVVDLTPAGMVMTGQEMERHQEDIFPTIQEQRRGAKREYHPGAAVDTVFDAAGVAVPQSGPTVRVGSSNPFRTGSKGSVPQSTMPDRYEPTGGGSAIWPRTGPGNVAARRVSEAAQKDYARVHGVEPETVSPAQMRQAAEFEINRGAAQGQPVRLMDMGPETHSLARDAANKSATARGTLDATINPRYEQQASRVVNWFRRVFHDPTQGLRRLEDARDAARSPTSRLYRDAFTQGNRALANQGLTQMFDSAEGREILGEAVRRVELKQRAGTLGGHPAYRPGPGRVTNDPLTRAQQGTLVFWDQVKRILDDRVGGALSAGNRELARDWGAVRDRLLQRLDMEVPRYATARGLAAQVFRAGDAFEAGQQIAHGEWTRHEIEQAFQGIIDGKRAFPPLGPQERQLVQAGFLHDTLSRLERIPDRQSILGRLAESPQERDKIRAVIGPQMADELETLLAVEGNIDRIRTAMGNSTTARQLSQANRPGGLRDVGKGELATGAAATAVMGWKGLLASALMGVGRRAAKASEQKVADEIATMLTSNDPNVYYRGIRRLVAMPSLRDNLWNALRSREGLTTIGVKEGAEAVRDVGEHFFEPEGAGPENPAPMPADQALRPGTWYQDPRGPRQYWPQP